jgi:DNA-binding response OmpR family regulator
VAKVLLIDDDVSLLEVLGLSLGDAGHTIIQAVDGAEGVRRVHADSPEIIVCDIGMPRLDGFSVCRQLRAAGVRTPILLLTSRDSEIDEALGLDLGADDFVTKPFSTRVLLSRVTALLRREAMASSPPEGPSAPLVAGSLTLDVDRLAVTYAGRPIQVTVTELRLLEALASRPGLVLSRQRLLEIVRGDDSVVADRIIDTYVRRLRRKLEAVDPTFEGIETIIGAGYRWRSG